MLNLEPTDSAAITRYPHPTHKSLLSREEKISAIADHFAHILEILGLDITDASLRKTPERVAHMYVDELFSGLDPKAFPEISYLDNDLIEKTEGMIVITDIPIKSICEHHFVPIIGKATVAYIPKDKILGLSKINRVVDYFSRRPQLQERLTVQIADCLKILLDIQDVAVQITAEHFCVTIRGIQHPTSRTHTCVLHGHFKQDPIIRERFFRPLV